jgi:type I restriction enzyme, S subunit
MTDKIPLGEICEFTYGDALKEQNRLPGKVPVYGSNGIVGWHNEALTRGKTIVIGRKGSIGEINWSDLPCFPIDTTYFVDSTKKPCDLKWLFYALLQLDLTRLNKSAAVPGLNREDAYDQRVVFPSPLEQQRITGLLERADRLRRVCRYGLTLCDEVLSAAFLEKFGDPRTNPNKYPRAVVEELGKVQTGTTPPRERTEFYGTHIEWIKSDNITLDDIYPTKAVEGLSLAGEQVGTVVQSGSLLVTCIAGSLASIGNVVLTNRRVAFNQQINAITSHPDVDPLFLYSLMLVAKPLVQRGATKAMKKMITKSKLEELLLFKPALAEQSSFGSVLTQWSRMRQTTRESLHQADHLFQTLLHQAFSTP